MEEGVGIPQGYGGDIRGLGNILPDRYVYRDPSPKQNLVGRQLSFPPEAGYARCDSADGSSNMDMRVIKTKEKEMKSMKKRNLKFMALFLSVTMIFSMNSFAFGAPSSDGDNTDEVQVEASKDEEPEVLGIIDPGDIVPGSDYDDGYTAGLADANADKVNKTDPKEEYKKRTADFKDADKVRANGYTEEYQAGYYAGYASTPPNDYYDGLDDGFGAGVNDGVYGGKYDERVAANDTFSPTTYLKVADKDDAAYNGEKYKEGYQKGYDLGWDSGVSRRAAYAKNRAERYFNGTTMFAGFQYTDAKPYSELATGYYKTIEDQANGFSTEYVTAWRAAYDAFYGDRAKESEKEGKERGKIDGRNNTKKPSEVADADLATYVAALNAADPGYGDDYAYYWNVYNKKNVADADGFNADPVNETYIEAFIKGYDSVYAAAQSAAKKRIDADDARDAYYDGFTKGYDNGIADGNNMNTDADDAAKKDDGTGAYYNYVNDANNTPEQIAAYKQGYEDGYNYASKDRTEEDGYDFGYASGLRDGQNDRYLGNDFDGYYEPDYEDSTYSIFKGSDTSFAKGYVTGYEAGYKTGLNQEANDRTAGDAFDYTSTDLNAWKISADPETWDTSQLLIWERKVPQIANVGQNLFFDTQELTTNWRNLANAPAPGIGLELSDEDAAGQVFAGNAEAEIIAISPFQYYFDLYAHDHLVDTKTISPNNLIVKQDVYVDDIGHHHVGINNGSIGQYVYKAIGVSSNKKPKPKKLPDGTVDNGKTYVLIRYRLADAETDENYKVIRYSYDANGAETKNIDNINDYYNGSEPVVEYDSRKIGGVKPENPKGKYAADNHVYNDKSTRNAIDAEALVVSWTEGAPAKLVGKLNLNVAAKNNVAATVPHTYLTYLGDTEMEDIGLISEYEDVDGNNQGVHLVQTDKRGVGAGDFFSKYYKVTKDNQEGGRGIADRGVVTFAGTESAAKLTNADNVFINKKGDSPSFTLKAKKIDPALKAYSKDIKTALKSAVFNFEISRMKIASDYDTDISDVTGAANDGIDFFFEDNKVMNALIAKFTPAPKRSECSDAADYQKKVEDYRVARAAFDGTGGYTHSDEFLDMALAAFKEAEAAYKAQYASLTSRFGSKLDYYQKWIEETWATDINNYNAAFAYVNPGDTPTFPYIVTEDDRTDGADRVIPVANTKAYRDLVPEDANADGKITAVEFWEYDTYVTGGIYDDQYDERFNGVLDANDNIIPSEEGLAKGEIDYDFVRENIAVHVAADRSEVTGVDFRYEYSLDGVDGLADTLSIRFDDDDAKYYYYNAGLVIPSFDGYYDFLVDQQTDIELIEELDPLEDRVIYPGGQEIAVFSGSNPAARVGQDRITIDFVDPKVKVKKAAMEMTVTPKLITRLENAGPNRIVVEKKLKTTVVKAGATPKKIGKADIKIEQKTAETEPFVVASGINNYEGQIAIRQRKDGSIGYGYFKDDNFYYVFNDEK